MKHAYIFPGQGAQFTGMGKNLYEENTLAREYFEQANEILGFRITDVMFSGSEEDLKQTEVTQPAIFLHSAILFETTPNLRPDMVAGHSLGEISALVACKALTFEDGLKLVSRRALAMQHACVKNPSTMAAILGMDDAAVEEIAREYKNDGVVVANYNCPGQVIISGSIEGIERASERFKASGAKQVVTLKVGGGFHSPHMEPAREEFALAVENTTFNNPTCPVYQNVDAHPYIDPKIIKQNLINQLTSPVLWTQTMQKMLEHGATQFTEVGPGRVLQGLLKKINRAIPTEGIN